MSETYTTLDEKMVQRAIARCSPDTPKGERRREVLDAKIKELFGEPTAFNGGTLALDIYQAWVGLKFTGDR